LGVPHVTPLLVSRLRWGADPWSKFKSTQCWWQYKRDLDLGSVIVDCENKHYNKGVTPG